MNLFITASDNSMTRGKGDTQGKNNYKIQDLSFNMVSDLIEKYQSSININD